MARDSQAALVALNRFGFGARGGASGDFVNAASDPRGFVKAELLRPNGVLLEVPGLQSTPALGKAVFDYQFEIQQARDAAAKAAPATGTEAPAQPSSPDAKAQRRNLSLSSIAMDITAKEAPPKPADGAGATMADPSAKSAETMQPNAPKPKRLSATRAACESRAIRFPLAISLKRSRAYIAPDYTAVRDEPEINSVQEMPPRS